MFDRIREDLAAFRERDPAAASRAQIFFLYPGFHALLYYRAAHWLYGKNRTFLARWVSQRGRFKTGIEIHPGAKIGRGLVIDHGMGVVIGETAEIGDNCLIYQGVTLGGTGKDVGKRHPTLGDDVMVGAGAKVLGPITIGSHSKVAAGAVVLDDMPEHTTAVGVPARVVRRRGQKVSGKSPCGDLDQVHIPDPIAQELCRLRLQCEHLEKALDALKQAVCLPGENLPGEIIPGKVFPGESAQEEGRAAQAAEKSCAREEDRPTQTRHAEKEDRVAEEGRPTQEGRPAEERVPGESRAAQEGTSGSAGISAETNEKQE